MFKMKTAKSRGSLLQRGAAVLMTGILCASLTACGDTSYAMKVDGEKIPAGIYLLNQISAFSEAQSKDGYDSTLDNIWDNKVDDQALADWVNARAKELTLNYVEVEKMFEEKDFTLSDEDEETISYQVDNAWSTYEKTYNKLGIAKDSYEAYVANSIKKTDVFNSYYGPDGTEAVTDAELLTHFQNDYAQVDILRFSTYDTENSTTMNEEQKAVVEEKANGYLERAKNGEDMAALYDELNEVDAADHTEDGATHSHITTIKKDASSYYVSDKLNKAIFEGATAGGDPVLLTDDNAYYVVKRHEITQDNITDSTRSGLLSDLKGDDFDKILSSAAKDLSVELNDNTIKAFNPQKITKVQSK